MNFPTSLSYLSIPSQSPSFPTSAFHLSVAFLKKRFSILSSFSVTSRNKDVPPENAIPGRHQAKHSSTTKPQCQSKSERAYAEIVSQLRKRGPKERSVGGYIYLLLAGACLFPMPIVLTGGWCLAFDE